MFVKHWYLKIIINPYCHNPKIIWIHTAVSNNFVDNCGGMELQDGEEERQL